VVAAREERVCRRGRREAPLVGSDARTATEPPPQVWSLHQPTDVFIRSASLRPCVQAARAWPGLCLFVGCLAIASVHGIVFPVRGKLERRARARSVLISPRRSRRPLAGEEEEAFPSIPPRDARSHAGRSDGRGALQHGAGVGGCSLRVRCGNPQSTLQPAGPPFVVLASHSSPVQMPVACRRRPPPSFLVQSLQSGRTAPCSPHMSFQPFHHGPGRRWRLRGVSCGWLWSQSWRISKA
jgi:hypothetical protein